MMWQWVLFNVFVVAMLALDLGVFHRKSHTISVREAFIWTAVWIALACIFGLGVYFLIGTQASIEFMTGYLVEKSLSVDNIFVILMIFTYFSVPSKLQHKVLFWGIIGALVMRAAFIYAGVALITQYHWIIYIFGAFLVFSGIKMAIPKKEDVPLDRNLVLRLLHRIIPVSHEYETEKFFVRHNGKIVATPLFAALIMVETTDLIFAVDSIPAILAISSDPFIVYTSNVFAILGMRSLYFAVSRLVALFHHLSYGLSAILIFVGLKMLVSDFYKMPTLMALSVILGFLGISILTSVLWPPKK